jgi:hypothetical protein
LLYAVPQLDSLDQDSILAIHKFIAEALFPGLVVLADIQARIQALYPHIREWKA